MFDIGLWLAWHPSFSSHIWHQSPGRFTAVNLFPRDVLFIIFPWNSLNIQQEETFPLPASEYQFTYNYFISSFIFAAHLFSVQPSVDLRIWFAKLFLEGRLSLLMDMHSAGWCSANLIQISLWHIITFLLNLLEQMRWCLCRLEIVSWQGDIWSV